jgi:hypothetical protein
LIVSRQSRARIDVVGALARFERVTSTSLSHYDVRHGCRRNGSAKSLDWRRDAVAGRATILRPRRSDVPLLCPSLLGHILGNGSSMSLNINGNGGRIRDRTLDLSRVNDCALGPASFPIRTARAGGRPSTARQQQIRFCSSSVHAPICASTGLFVLISHENWCLGLP